MPADHSGGPVCGRTASGWLSDCRENVVRLAACWRATLLLVPDAGAQFPVSDGHFLCVAGQSPAAPGPVRVSEQTRRSQAVCRQRADQLVSSTPTVAETVPFVQRNLRDADFRGLSGW